MPGVMVSGLTSDLPGKVVGQDAENVNDAATGNYLLIPQGSKLVGSYDSRVTMGQRRALVAWKRIIYPDASSLDLDSMPGADQSGYAGFTDKVNNHYLRVFGSAAVLSLFSAGVSLSQPRQTGMYESNQQVMTAAMGQQLGELGMEVTRRNLNIQPTIEIRPGYQFVIMITKDIVLPQTAAN